jgi:hypothetical protein
MNALVAMPNFKEELQTNNVLTRRILELKVQKGFHVNKEEAEKSMKANMKKYTTNVSSALNANSGGGASGLDIDSILAPKKLGFGTGVPKKAEPI